MENSKKGGNLNFIVYQDPETKLYCGLCLQLGLYDSSDNLEALKKNLVEAAKGYVHTVMKDKLSDSLLNVPPTQSHLEIFKKSLVALQPMINEEDKGAYSTSLSVFQTTISNQSLVGTK
jgi:hypothetical protein